MLVDIFIVLLAQFRLISKIHSKLIQNNVAKVKEPPIP